MQDDHALNSPVDGAMGRRGRRGSIPAPPFDGGAGRASAGNNALADGSPKAPRAAGAAAVAATPKGSERRVLFSDEIPVGKDAATPNLLAQVLSSPGKAYRRIFGRGGARDATNDAPSPTADREPAVAPEDHPADASDEEIAAVEQLARRVLDETGLALARGWTASIVLSGQKRRTRFFSPGGKRHGSAAEVVQHIEKQRTGGVDVDDIDGVEEASEEHLRRLKRAADEAENAEAEEKEDKEDEEADEEADGDDEDDEGSDDDDDEEEEEEEEEEEAIAPTQAAPPREDEDDEEEQREDEFITIRKDLAAALDAEASAVPGKSTKTNDEIAAEIDKLRELAREKGVTVDLTGWTCKIDRCSRGWRRRVYVAPGGSPRQLDTPNKAIQYAVEMSNRRLEEGGGEQAERRREASPGADRETAAEKTAAEKMATPAAHPGEAAAKKALDALRRKVEMKLDHELEDGWTVDWKMSATSGKSEKVYTDPEGVELWGDGQALTHVKSMLEARRLSDKRKALEAMQAELAAEEAKFQAEREEEERKIREQFEEEERKIAEMERANAEAAARAAEEVRRREREKQAEVEKLRAELQRKREAMAAANARAGLAAGTVLALPPATYTPAPALTAPGADVAALPAPPRRTPPQRKGKTAAGAQAPAPGMDVHPTSPPRRSPRATTGPLAGGASAVLSPRTATTLAVNKATDSPDDARFPRRPDETEEERAVRELRERVYGETGVTLGEDWTAKVEIKESSGDRRKSSGGKRRTRFYSPGGRRFSSASEVVSYVQDTLAKARVEQGLPVAPKSAERSRRSHVHYAHQNGGAAADDDDDECAADETVEHAKRAFLQHVREETGVQLTASRWRVEFEAANTSSASKRKRFFAPDGRKFSSQSKVVQMLTNPGFSYRKLDPSAKRVGEPTPKSTVGRTPSRVARAKVRVGVTPRTAARLHVHPRGEDDPLSPDAPVDVDQIERQELHAKSLKELNSKVKAELGIKMTPGWTVRTEKTASGKTYNRFYNADGKRFSSHADIIAYMKKQLNVEDDTEGPRNLAAAMELAAGDDKDATDGGKATRRSARATAGAKPSRDAEQAPKRRPARAAVKPAAGKPAAGKPAAASEKPAASKKSVTLPKTSTGAKTATATKKSSPSNSLATPALAKAAPPRVPTPTTNPSALEKEALKTFYDVIREEFPSITIQGWRVEIRERKTGNSQGTTDKYYFPPPLSKSSPPGMEDLPKKFRSMNEVMSYVKVRYLGAGVDIVKRRKKGAKAPSKGAKAKASKTAAGAKRTARGEGSKVPAAKRARPARGGKTAAKEVEVDEDEDDEEDASDSDEGSESDDEDTDSEDESESESESEEEEDDNDVTVEGMVTVEERQARLGREPENKPLTPAKASELAEEVENCIEDPEMGFDVDVLLLLHQKVTGFEADCDDALELREMIQRAVRKKTEEAYAYAVSTGKKKPSRRASAGGGARMVSPTTAADGRRAADVRRKFASAAAASPARPSKRAKASRREDEDEDIEDVRGGTRVAMTLGNVNMNTRRGSRLNNRDDDADAAAADDDDDMEIADGSTQPAGTGPVYVEIKTEDEEDEVRLSQNDSSFEGLDAAAAEPASPEPSLPALGTAAVVWNAADPHMVNQAKQRLHTSVMPGGFAKCRERERRKVVDIIQGCLKKRRSGSVYVCGLPGTGKSLTVSQAEKMIRCWGDGSKEGGGDRHALPAKQRPRVAAVNCMALSEPRHVFARVIEELGGVPPALDVNGADANGAADVTQLPEVAALRQLVCGTPTDANSRGSRNGAAAANQPMTVVLLDEMDQLICKDQAILYELFGLPTLPGSRCVIVGVANAINLVEVTLPRLAARGCEPTVVSFNAYDKDQLQKLLKQRLAGLPFAVFEDAGLELVARKVAAATGDMRRALNICTNAIDICAGEAARAAEEGAAPADPGGFNAPGEDGTLVKMHHVARAISASFNSPVVETMRGLPQHQQMVLCAAVRLFRTAARKETALGVLNDQYTKLCKESKLKGLTSGEFSGVCTVLADLTLLKVGPGREDRQRKVSLGVHADDVVFALQGVNFFRNLIGELNKGA